jgi:hypothetical protein
VIKLLGNANAHARTIVIAESLRESSRGTIVSIRQSVADKVEHEERISFTEVEQVSQRVPTTLRELAPIATFYLILHGYRAMQAALDEYEVETIRRRSADELVQEVMLGADPTPHQREFWRAWREGLKLPSRKHNVRPTVGRGPYARRLRSITWLSRIVEATVIVATPIAVVVIYWFVTTK